MTWEWTMTSMIPTIRHIPKCIRTQWMDILHWAAQGIAADPSKEERWTLLFSLSKLLLRMPPRSGRRKDLAFQAADWLGSLLVRARQGDWTNLFTEARGASPPKNNSTHNSRPDRAGNEMAIRQRALMLVEEGQYAKAVKSLNSEGIHTLTDQTIRDLRAKHPQTSGKRKAKPTPPPVDPSPCSFPLIFTQADVSSCIRSFPRGTAPGGSGLRAQHLADALDAPLHNNDNSFTTPLARVCSILASGAAPPSIAPWVAGAPIYPLKKKGDGIRPIAVGEVLRRLVGKLILANTDVQKKIDTVMMEAGQLGVRVKNGADVITQAARFWMADPNHKDHIALKVDFENAFNTIDRQAIRRELNASFPNLIPWFDFCYSQPAFLSCQGALLPFFSSQGVQQGDPLGPFLFALGIRPLGKKLQGDPGPPITTDDAVPNPPRQQGAPDPPTTPSRRNSLSLWFLDDGLLFGPANIINEAWKTIVTEARKVGLRVNPTKCELWNATDRSLLPNIPREVPGSDPEGFELLGTGVGSARFCEKVMLKRIQKIEEALSKLHIIDDPQVELALLRCCLGFPRLAFAIRSTPPGLIREATRQFDRIMERTAEERFDINFTEPRRKQWQLPVRMGGVGIPRAEDVAPAAYLANVFDCNDKLKSILHRDDITPGDIPGGREAWEDLCAILNDTPPPLPEDIEAQLKTLHLNNKHPDPTTRPSAETFIRENLPPGEKPQHFLHALIQETRLRQCIAHQLGSSSPTDEDVPNPCQEPQARALLRLLALLRGDRDNGYANSWLNVVPNNAHGHKMPKAAFAIALKWILGDVVCPDQRCPESTATNRPCSTPLDPWGDHAVCCPTGPSRIARHDYVNTTWLATLGSVGFHVRAEVRTGIETHRRSADTLVYNWEKGNMAAHDWTVSHVLRSQGLAARNPDPNWAVREAESNKTRREGGECAARGIDFLPLAIDTFGGLGVQAARAIAKVANHVRICSGDDSRPNRSQKRISQNLRFVNMKGIAYQILRRCVPTNTTAVDDTPQGIPTARSNAPLIATHLPAQQVPPVTHGFQHHLHQRHIRHNRFSRSPGRRDPHEASHTPTIDLDPTSHVDASVCISSPPQRLDGLTPRLTLNTMSYQHLAHHQSAHRVALEHPTTLTFASFFHLPTSASPPTAFSAQGTRTPVCIQHPQQRYECPRIPQCPRPTSSQSPKFTPPAGYECLGGDLQDPPVSQPECGWPPGTTRGLLAQGPTTDTPFGNNLHGLKQRSLSCAA